MKDIRGIEIEVGDLVTAPFVRADMMTLKAGKVVQILEDKQKIRVDWTFGWGATGEDKPTLIILKNAFGPKVAVLEKGADHERAGT